MPKSQVVQRTHPKAGQTLTVKQGPLTGQQVLVINYLTSQYQGKDIKRIKADHLTTATVNRGFPLDADFVFVQFYPSMSHGCVHDSELRVKLVEAPKAEEPAKPENVKSIRSGKKKKDATQEHKGE